MSIRPRTIAIPGVSMLLPHRSQTGTWRGTGVSDGVAVMTMCGRAITCLA
jgi:hypothetical protein